MTSFLMPGYVSRSGGRAGVFVDAGEGGTTVALVTTDGLVTTDEDTAAGEVADGALDADVPVAIGATTDPAGAGDAENGVGDGVDPHAATTANTASADATPGRRPAGHLITRFRAGRTAVGEVSPASG